MAIILSTPKYNRTGIRGGVEKNGALKAQDEVFIKFCRNRKLV